MCRFQYSYLSIIIVALDDPPTQTSKHINRINKLVTRRKGTRRRRRRKGGVLAECGGVRKAFHSQKCFTQKGKLCGNHCDCAASQLLQLQHLVERLFLLLRFSFAFVHRRRPLEFYYKFSAVSENPPAYKHPLAFQVIHSAFLGKHRCAFFSPAASIPSANLRGKLNNGRTPTLCFCLSVLV